MTGSGAQLTAAEARDALLTVARGRRRVSDEIGLPGWYWVGLSAGWVVLGVLADLGHPVVSAVATFVFGSVHAAVAARVLDGRHRSGRLAVGVSLTGRRLARAAAAGLLGMTALTVAAAVLLDRDGAGHPVTIASVGVAAAILLGGPRLVEVVRRRSTAG